MKLPKAFYTSRVTEALDSLATHIISAHDIAASLRPVLTSSLTLVAEEEPRPIIRSVTPTGVRLAASENSIQQTFTIKGRNLSNTSLTAFELVLESDPSEVLYGSTPTFDTATHQFTTAVLVTRGAQPGIYEVRVNDADGTPHLPGFNVELQIEEIWSSTAALAVVAPKITKPPQDKKARVGDSLTLSVEATGTDLHYQWLKDGAKITSAGDREYTVPQVAKKHSGRYTVIVGNSAGIAIGRPAEVRVS